MLNGLPGNTRVVLLLEPFSSMLACVLTFYTALYMQGNGLDAGQIGLIASIAAVTGVGTQFFAAPITNRFGRRRTLLVFSILCWSVSLLLWRWADGFGMFLLAAVVFSTSKIAAVAWYCVLTEDVIDERKPYVFGFMFIIASVGGIATAFAGPVLTKYGLVHSMRVLYGSAALIMTVMFILRHALLRENGVGQSLRTLHATLSPGDTARRCLAVVLENMGNRAFRHLTLAWVLFNIALAMGFVQILFMNNTLRLTVGQLSMVPPVTAVVSIILFRFVVPRLPISRTGAGMACALAAGAAGLGLLLIVPPEHPAPALLAAALIAGGGYVFQVVINAELNNAMGPTRKADIYSAVQLLVALATIPAGWLAGSLFSWHPELAIAATGCLMLAAMQVIRHSCRCVDFQTQLLEKVPGSLGSAVQQQDGDSQRDS